MEGQTDWTGSKKVMNPHENEPIDWKSIPVRRSRIVELMLKDKFGDAGNPKEKDSHIGYGTHNSHRHYHPHYYHHHFHNHQLSNAPKTNIQGEDKMDDNQEERLVGTLFASKAVFQLLFNPVSMKLIQSYGHNCTQTIALMVLLCSSLTYAFSQGIKTMFLARCIHGVGSSIISISGMATIANLFQDEKARCQIMGISLGGIAAGVLVGYPFGGFAYDFCGKQLPFLLIAFLFTLIIGFQLTFMPNEKESHLKIESFHFVGMVKDLDIMLAIGSIFFTTSITAVCEPILPIYLIDSLNAPEWQLGIAFLPDAFGYIIGAHILGFDKHSVDKWVITIISLFLAGFATILIPLTTHFYQLIIPQFASGLSIGITDAAMSTQLASIVDERYSANYSMIYTFSQIAVCLAYIIGPIVSSIVLPSIGTTGSFHVLGTTVILYGIVCISYRVYLAEIFGRNLSEVIPILSWNSYETIENP
uniref:Major facilitator superfamily (MFS) profile domain-containing protein n=2 Tax=Tetranychus urticae TaxID=32264 RepID=T1KBQ9_TETUR